MQLERTIYEAVGSVVAAVEQRAGVRDVITPDEVVAEFDRALRESVAVQLAEADDAT